MGTKIDPWSDIFGIKGVNVLKNEVLNRVRKTSKMKSRIIRKKGRIIIPKPSKNEARTYPKWPKNRCRNWAPEKVAKSDVPDSLPVYSFWSKIRPKSSKLLFFQIFGTQKGIRKLMPKKYGKSMPKGSQNETKMDAKTINCSYFFKKGENGRNYLFYNIKLVFANEETMKKLWDVHLKLMLEKGM